MTRREDEDNEANGLVSFAKANIVAIIIAVVSFVGWYANWQTTITNNDVITGQQIGRMNDRIEQNSEDIKEQKADIKAMQLDEKALTIQLSQVEKNEIRLQTSMDKLTDMLTTFLQNNNAKDKK
ncbi:hypothetical protein [Yersinia phage vB_YenM_P778]